jgi:hypothetical protein
VGDWEGRVEGRCVGDCDGRAVGVVVGRRVGLVEGSPEGEGVGPVGTGGSQKSAATRRGTSVIGADTGGRILEARLVAIISPAPRRT